MLNSTAAHRFDLLIDYPRHLVLQQRLRVQGKTYKSDSHGMRFSREHIVKELYLLLQLTLSVMMAGKVRGKFT